MKKVLKSLSKVILIISIIIVFIIVFLNLLTIIRIVFWGITVGNDEYPDTIWWGKTTLKGLSGLKTYYNVWRQLAYMFEIPISVACIIYQVIYFKIIRKKLRKE